MGKKQYPEQFAGDDGWCEFSTPIMDGFGIACCDCGLVHEFQFVAIKVVKKNRNGTFSFEDLSTKKFRVKIRARRNNRSTGQIRRHRKFRLPNAPATT